jgi:hypothetical protein
MYDDCLKTRPGVNLFDEFQIKATKMVRAGAQISHDELPRYEQMVVGLVTAALLCTNAEKPVARVIDALNLLIPDQDGAYIERLRPSDNASEPVRAYVDLVLATFASLSPESRDMILLALFNMVAKEHALKAKLTSSARTFSIS